MMAALSRWPEEEEDSEPKKNKCVISMSIMAWKVGAVITQAIQAMTFTFSSIPPSFVAI